MKALIVGTLVGLTVCFTAVACLGLSATFAPRGVLSCPTSTTVCPRGDWGWIEVVVSDLVGHPITVSAAGPFCFKAGQTPQVFPSSGVDLVIFDQFGGCGGITVTVSCPVCMATIVTPAPIFVASPDNNASCKVDATDLLIFAGSYGRNVPCCDYDCSSRVDGVDLMNFAKHYGHQ